MAGKVKVSSGAPIVVQSMSNTQTTDVRASVRQIMELVLAGSCIVRVTVNTEEAVGALPEIVNR